MSADPITQLAAKHARQMNDAGLLYTGDDQAAPAEIRVNEERAIESATQAIAAALREQREQVVHAELWGRTNGHEDLLSTWNEDLADAKTELAAISDVNCYGYGFQEGLINATSRAIEIFRKLIREPRIAAGAATAEPTT